MEILDQFGINPLLLAAQVVNFLVLLFILKKFLYGPILKVLETRKKAIVQSLKNVEEIEIRLRETNEKIDQMIAKASEEGQKIIDESKMSAAQIIDESKLKAETEVQAILRRGQDSLIAEREKMMGEIKSQVSDIVVVALQKVTGKVVTKEDQKKIIDQSVRNIS